MAVEDDIRGTGVLTNKAPELPTSEPAFDDGSLACLGINTDTRRKLLTCKRKGMEGKELHDAMGTYQGWMNYGNTKNLKYKLNNIGNGKVFK